MYVPMFHCIVALDLLEQMYDVASDQKTSFKYRSSAAKPDPFASDSDDLPESIPPTDSRKRP